jgi:hypothetical protein
MVKKILMGLSLIAMMAGSATAQHVNLGVKVGLNFYKNVNSNDVKTDFRTGFNLGLLGHIHINDVWALQPEVYYSTQGYKANTTKVRTGYVNIPILLQYMFNNGFRIQAGPQLGIMTNATLDAAGVSSDYKGNYKALEAALSVGISYVHPPSSFGVDLRYNHGLTNINESDANKTYNRGIQLGVFYLINHQN